MSVLAKSELRERLDGQEIFKDETWDENCIRGAAYDLRVAPDYLIAADGTRYWPRSPAGRTEFRDEIVLEPGEVAFVSSVEQVCMPPDLVGNIAQKFRLARVGFLVMGGLLVDPGYGMSVDADGNWTQNEPGERLHFQLANIGGEVLRLVPERDSIAGIQFLPLKGSMKGTGDRWDEVRIPNSVALIDSLFDHGDDEPLAPLDFFSRSREVAKGVARLDTEAKRQRAKLDATERSTDQLVVFGVFLVSITLFTVAVAALLDALSGSTIKDVVNTGGKPELTWTAFAIAVVVLAVIGGACALMMRSVVGFVERRRESERPLKRPDQDSAAA